MKTVPLPCEIMEHNPPGPNLDYEAIWEDTDQTEAYYAHASPAIDHHGNGALQKSNILYGYIRAHLF